jgi:hypothetical protein
MLWHFINPYFVRLAFEAEQRSAALLTSRIADLQKDTLVIAHRLASIERTLCSRTEAETRVRDLARGIEALHARFERWAPRLEQIEAVRARFERWAPRLEQIETLRAQFDGWTPRLGQIEAQILPAVHLSSRIAGLQKDITAVAHRLASIECTLGSRTDAETRVQDLTEGIEALHARFERLAPQLEQIEALHAQFERWAPRLEQIEALISPAIHQRRHSDDGSIRRVMIQYACGDEHGRLLDATRPLHTAYCSWHGIDYWPCREDASVGRSPHWRKVELLIKAMESGYDQAAWLDTDCVIVDPSFNLFNASSYGIAACECFDSPRIERHLSTGFLLITRSPAVFEFLRSWNAMPSGGKWEDQSAFIEMMASRPHRDILTILPNRFNCLAEHMEAREPFIRAFHGDPARSTKLPALVATIKCTWQTGAAKIGPGGTAGVDR